MVYDIAGLRVKIENQYAYTDKFCQAYLSKDQLSPADIIAQVTEEEFAAFLRSEEAIPSQRERYRGYFQKITEI